MAEHDSMSVNRALFNLGARLGSLAGYLYAEEKVEKKYLPNWIDNIAREFAGLPAEVGGEIAKDYREVWRKVEALLVRIYGDSDATTLQARSRVRS